MCSPTRIILNPNGLKRGNDGYKNDGYKNDGYLKNDLNTNFQKVDLKRLYGGKKIAGNA